MRDSRDTAERIAESCVGRVLNGFPRRLDGDLMWPTPIKEDYRRRVPNSKQQGLPEAIHKIQQFPAGPGDQYDWEPPRVAKGVKNRVDRLKGLGNSVCPQQAYPILAAIAELEAQHD
jgi:hypothetical protein